MAESPFLGLPYLEAGQAQKHVTHNEALRMLDALVQLSVVSVAASPPGSPEEGDRRIVAASATGAFATHDNEVALYEDAAWRFMPPQPGWRAWNEDEEALLVWNGSTWVALEAGGGGGSFDPEDVPYLFLNDAAPADAAVKLAMRGEAALLHAIPSAESGNGDVRLQISKETAGDTASVFFATNFSGRAEFGLAGSDNFKLKVSADGTSWTEALDIDKGTGRARLPAALALTDSDQVVAKRHVRELLTANRTYYVRTDGSNSNDGLANTSGGAFLTIQKAYDTICAALDLGGYTATIQIADGTYTGATTFAQPWTGGGAVIIQGNASTPANVVVNPTSASCFKNACALPGVLTIKNMKLQTTTSGDCIRSIAPGLIYYGNINFGGVSSGSLHVYAAGSGVNITALSSYTISGGGYAHIAAAENAKVDINANAITVTLSGTPAFTTFVEGSRGGVLMGHGVTFSGSATGSRFTASDCGVVFTNSGGANYFPGNSAGSGSNLGASPYGRYV